MIKLPLLYLFSFFCLAFLESASAQVSGDKLNNVSDTSLVFLGYDLSHAKILDRKRIGMQSDQTLAAIHKHLRKTLSEQKIKDLVPVKNVRLNYNPTDLINSKTDSTNVITTGKQLISADSIQAFVDRYQVVTFNGPAAVVIFEYFGRKTKTTSAYLVLIDMPSKKVTRIEHIKSVDGNSYRKLSDWNYAAYIATVRLIKQFAHTNDSVLRMVRQNEVAFKPTFFKRTYDELPVTFTMGPVLGFSSALISGGVTADMDIYHILIGGRILMHPLISFLSEETIIEKSFYLGYRYRKQTNMVSVGAGFGKVSYFCHEDGSYCENYNEETISTFPLYIAYDYFQSPNIGFGISLNTSVSSRSSQFAILAGIKFGIAWLDN